ncbi:MAG: hypothetical protein FIB01_13095 [Gemmatimonadetes bacterium]|nr:hypothetical protein [Gemmatimonadota bacterium]
MREVPPSRRPRAVSHRAATPSRSNAAYSVSPSTAPSGPGPSTGVGNLRGRRWTSRYSTAGRGRTPARGGPATGRGTTSWSIGGLHVLDASRPWGLRPGSGVGPNIRGCSDSPTAPAAYRFPSVPSLHAFPGGGMSNHRLMLAVVAPLLTVSAAWFLVSCGDTGVVDTPIEPGSVVLSSSSGSLQVGETLALTAQCKGPNGENLSARPITWSSSSPTVASVANGTVTALAAGQTTITASCGSRSATASVTVVSRPVLTVNGTGNGAGAVSGTGIACNIAAGAASGDCTETYNGGTAVVLTATPAASSNFATWSGACTGNGNCSFTIGQNSTVTARFDLKTFSIAVSAGTGGTATGGGTFNYGASVTVTATAAVGYRFVNWTEGGTEVSTSASYAFTATANRTLVANFQQTEPRTLTVLGGGNGAGNVSATGYTCAITAGATAGDCAETLPVGTVVTLTAAPATGSSFTGWTGACTGTGTCQVTVPDQNISVTATFTLNQYTITASASPANGGSVSGGGTFNHGATVTLTATPTATWSLRDWTEGGTVVSTSRTYTFTATNNRTLVANFVQAPSYDLRVTGLGTGTGTVTASGINCTITAGVTSGACYNTYIDGTGLVLTAAPNASSTFVGWTGDCSGAGLECGLRMTGGNKTATANFAIKTYTIAASVNPAGGGSVTGTGTVNHGATVTLTATPAANYSFASWTEGGSVVGVDQTLTFTATANRTLVANFNLKPLRSLTVNGLGNGTGNVAGTGIACTISAGSATGDCAENVYGGSAFTLTATPIASSNFIGWSGACTGAGTCSVSTTDGNKTATAQFDLKTFTIAASVNPAAGGYTSGSGTYNYGSSASVRAYNYTYYTFDRWTEGGSLVSYNNPYTFSATANRTLVAQLRTWPDLGVFLTSSCTSCYLLNNITFSGIFYNYGTAASGGFYWRLLVDGSAYGAYSQASIAANSSVNYAVTVPAAALGIGNHTIRVELDYTNVVNEWNESNNTASKSVSVYFM